MHLHDQRRLLAAGAVKSPLPRVVERVHAKAAGAPEVFASACEI